jgi:hypothetical protein
MKILINEQQLDIIGDVVTKLIMSMYKDVLCSVDIEPDDDGSLWVYLYFKESWYDTLRHRDQYYPLQLSIRKKSGEIRDFVNNVMGVKIRSGIGLKDC